MVYDHVNVDSAVITLSKVEEWDVEMAVWKTRQEVIFLMTLVMIVILMMSMAMLMMIMMLVMEMAVWTTRQEVILNKTIAIIVSCCRHETNLVLCAKTFLGFCDD